MNLGGISTTTGLQAEVARNLSNAQDGAAQAQAASQQAHELQAQQQMQTPAQASQADQIQAQQMHAAMTGIGGRLNIMA